MLKAVIAFAFIGTYLLTLPALSAEYQTNEVGLSNGQFKVSESGAAQYHVPISLPSGVAGVKPQVALNYNSQGGDGSLGVGWSLSAGSAIVRCGQNFVNDGKNLGVDYSAEDRFCYGGQRLIPNNSQSNYYTPGTRYHTEIDSFSIITGVGGSTSTGPQYFTVETKSGETHYFGNSGHPNSADAFVQTQQNSAIARYWAVKAIEDVKNNIILFNYTEDVTKGRHQLSQITYGGYRTNSVSQVTNNTHAVNFHYANNPIFDNKTGYIAGNLVGSDVHLSRIEVKQDNDVYLNYHLTYELPAHVEDKTYLTAIQECLDGSTSHCLAPMKFDWQKQASSSTFELVNTSPSTHGSSYMREGGSFVDLTGDGKPELIYPGQYGRWFIYGMDTNGNYSTIDVANSETSINNAKYSRIIDYNGDGRSDFMFISNNKFKVITAKATTQPDSCNQANSKQLCTNQTQTFSFVTVELNLDSYNKEESMIVDIEGDGLQDILYVINNTMKYHKNLGGTDGFSPAQALTVSSTTSISWRDMLDKATVVDVNGDGISDIVIEKWAGRTIKTVLAANGVGFEEYASFGSRGGSELYGFTPVDFNGDGLTDFAYIYNNKWHYRLSTGTGFTEQVQLKIAPSMGSAPSIDINGDYPDFYNQHRFADINGDGKTDVIAYREQYPNGYYDYSISYIDTNGQVQFVQRGTQTLNHRANLSFVDINGDGKIDIMSRQNPGDAWERYDALPNKEPFAVIIGFNNGFGPKTTLDYALINDPSVSIATPSTNNTSADYADITSGVYVVRQVETENSVTSNTTNKVSYAYGGALVHKKGRGFLGFEVLQTKNHQNEVTTQTRYHQMFPLSGKPKETLQYYQASYLMNRAVNTYESSTSVNGGVQSYLKSIEDFQWSFDFSQPTPVSYEMSKSHETNRFDDGGNLTSNVMTLSKHNGSDAIITTTTNSYSPSGYDAATAKRQGRIGQATVTKTRNGQSTTRTSSFSYYSDGLLKATAINGLSTTVFYDSRGNRTKVSKSGAVNSQGALQTRSSETEFSSNGRYPLWSENGLGERVTYAYNGSSGNSVSGRVWQMTTTSPNGLSSTKHFGYAGETVKVVHADGNESLLTREFCSTTFCENTAAYYVNSVNSPGKPQTKVFSNQFGQQIESRTKGFDGRWVLTKTEFDNFGRPYRISQPHFDGSNAYFNERIYDVFGRVIEERSPDVNNSTTVQKRQYQGFVTKITDPRNNVHTETRLINGKLDKKTNLNGSGHQQTIDYSYNPHGQLTQVATFDTSMAGKQSIIVNSYDNYGRKLSMDDPDKGQWTYGYNTFGEQISTLNANNQALTNTYDILGRVIHRTDVDGETCWSYGSTADAGINAVGKLMSVKQGTGNTCSTPTYSENYYFDSLGRLSQTDTLNQGMNFTSSLTYDQYSRVQEVNYPAGFQAFSIVNEYNTNHYPYKQTNGRTNALLREVSATDAYGNVTDESFGNGTETTRIFRAETGHISSLSLTDGANNSLHQISYNSFDKSGNLTNRSTTYGTVASSSYSEVFTYDRLNRLTNRSFSGQLPGLPTLATNFNYNYDGFGNFTDKAGDSSYEYSNSAKPNRLTRWDGQTLSYDDNGNVLTDGDRTFTYTAFDKTSNISNTAGHSTSYEYGHKCQVIYRTDHVQEASKWLTKSTHYVGGSYQRVNTHYDDGSQADKVEHQYFVGGIKVTQYEATNVERTNYLHQDFQGSTITVTDDNATVLKQYIYTPFGEQKVISGGLLASNMARGYTGHEMVNHLNIIQMGGRTYDATMGRFLQADIFIQAPNNSQSFNRYSYVMNNPMSYTDPSGYFSLGDTFRAFAHDFKRSFKKLYKSAMKADGRWASHKLTSKHPILHSIGMVALGAVKSPWGVVISAFVNFDHTFYQTGSLGKAFHAGGRTAATIGTLRAIGANKDWNKPGTVKNIAANAVVGGVSSSAEGGKFSHGFISAGFASAAKPMIFGEYGYSPDFKFERVMSAAVIGGTTSVIAGGKFANGALTGAFNQLYNGESYAAKKWEQIQSFAQDMYESAAWSYNAVADGFSSDFSNGFVEGMINFTGGRPDMTFGEQVLSTYGQTSLVFGPFELDKTAASALVSGQMAQRWGGMTFGQWAKTGFAPAPHLYTRGATLAHVGYTSAVNGVMVTAAYEGGNLGGSFIRTGLNRAFRYFGD